MTFKVASKFREAAETINTIPVDKYSLLLNRIIQKLHIRNKSIFNENEKSQLQGLFQLSEETLQMILDATSYLFEQAAFTSTGPEPLYALLLDAGFDEVHGKAVGRVWATEAAGFIAKLKDRTLGNLSLLNSDFHLHLSMSDSSDAKKQDPTALFEFTLGQLDKIQQQLDNLSS